MTILIVVVVASAAICGGLSESLAKHKGHDSRLAALVGFAFGIFGLLWAVGLPDLYQREMIRAQFQREDEATR
jgi:hypothetical protein